MADFNSIRQLVQNSIGRKYGNFDASVRALDNKYEKKQVSKNISDYYDNGKLVARSHEQKGLSGMHDMLGNATYFAGNENNKSFTSIWQNTPECRIKFHDTNHNGIVDENDEVEIKSKGEKDYKRMTISALIQND